MKMNLEQIRARNAWRANQAGDNFGGENEGQATAKKLPPLIQNHGLLQTLAFANEKGGGITRIMDHLARHLSDEDIAIVQNCDSCESLLTTLSNADSQLLKRATAESLAWLSYARRFL